MMRAGSNSCRKASFIALGVCMALAVPLPAQALRLWSWSYTGAGIAASGTFTTDDTPDSGGYYKIIGITGSRNGVAIICLEPDGDAIPGNPGFPVDNLVSASGRLTAMGSGSRPRTATMPILSTRIFGPRRVFSRSLRDRLRRGSASCRSRSPLQSSPKPSTPALLRTPIDAVASAARY